MVVREGRVDEEEPTNGKAGVEKLAYGVVGDDATEGPAWESVSEEARRGIEELWGDGSRGDMCANEPPMISEGASNRERDAT